MIRVSGRKGTTAVCQGLKAIENIHLNPEIRSNVLHLSQFRSREPQNQKVLTKWRGVGSHGGSAEPPV